MKNLAENFNRRAQPLGDAHYGRRELAAVNDVDLDVPAGESPPAGDAILNAICDASLRMLKAEDDPAFRVAPRRRLRESPWLKPGVPA